MTPRGFGPALTAVAAVAAAVIGVGYANPVPIPPIRTDALGPESGEPVRDYLDRAQASLTTVEGTAWALVSFTEPLTVDDVISATSDVRVSRIMFRVPIERVQTPLMSVLVPDNDEAVRRSADVAATRLIEIGGETERQRQVADASAKQLAAGCACAVGVLVRGTSEALAEVAREPSVRAVEALLPDASPWHAAVRPLLPENLEVVAPGPDDGPVP